MRGYEIWVNGNYVGKWESSYNTCHFDVTDFLKKGENLLAVRVYTHYKGFDFDGMMIGDKLVLTEMFLCLPYPIRI